MLLQGNQQLKDILQKEKQASGFLNSATSAENRLTIPSLRAFIDAIQDESILHKLFYHSLFDYRAVWDNKDYPIELVNKQRDELKDLLCGVCSTDRFKTQASYYTQFEDTILNQDILCKLILEKKLSDLGFVVKSDTKHGRFDLSIEDKNIHIELKRVISWSNYAKYFDDFYDKTDRFGKYLMTVLTTQPPRQREALSQLPSEEADAINDYVREIILAHYVIEKLLKRQKTRKIEFVVARIDIGRKDNIITEKTKDNLLYVRKQIGLKLKAFEEQSQSRWSRWSNTLYQKVKK